MCPDGAVCIGEVGVPTDADAITLGRTILYEDPKMNPKQMLHEKDHLELVLSMGAIPFYATYVASSVVEGVRDPKMFYVNNYYERHARAAVDGRDPDLVPLLAP